MIPFPRMAKYGNKIIPPPAKIQKIDSTTTSTVVLYSNGELYGFGANSNAVLGLGHSNVVPNITLIQTGVSDVWCSSSDILIRKGVNFLYSGAGQVVGETSVGVTTFTDCTTNFSTIDISTISKICVSVGTLVLTENGNLYGTGFNNGLYGNGSTARANSLILVNTSVQDVKVNKNSASWIVKDNRMYASGNNSSYNTGAGTNPSITSHTLITKFASVTSLDNLAVSNSTTFFYDGSALWGCGSKLGNGNNNALYSSFLASVGFNINYFGKKMFDSVYSSTCPIVAGCDVPGGPIKNLNYVGSNNYGQMGSGISSDVTAFTAMSSMSSIVSDFNLIEQFTNNAYMTLFVYNGKLYGAGRGGYLSGYSTDMTSFVQISTPL